MDIKRGDIYWAKLEGINSPPSASQPVLVIQNDIANRYAPTTIVAAINSQGTKAKLPTRIKLKEKAFGLTRESIILLEQIRTVDKNILKEKIGSLDEETMEKVSQALMIAQGIK